MGIGKAVRRLSGPLEPLLTNAYRAFFFDVDDFADQVSSLGPFECVVEIGCGEGALISALAQRNPSARFVGVDICEGVGRLFEGDQSRVSFERTTAEALAQRCGAVADLVIVCDVLHHVPEGERWRIWSAAESLAKAGGKVILKEWVKDWMPIYWIGYASDRFITGDKVQYETREAWMAQIESQAESWDVVSEMQLSPWKANHAFVLERTRVRSRSEQGGI